MDGAEIRVAKGFEGDRAEARRDRGEPFGADRLFAARRGSRHEQRRDARSKDLHRRVVARHADDGVAGGEGRFEVLDELPKVDAVDVRERALEVRDAALRKKRPGHDVEIERRPRSERRRETRDGAQEAVTVAAAAGRRQEARTAPIARGALRRVARDVSRKRKPRAQTRREVQLLRRREDGGVAVDEDAVVEAIDQFERAVPLPLFRNDVGGVDHVAKAEDEPRLLTAGLQGVEHRAQFARVAARRVVDEDRVRAELEGRGREDRRAKARDRVFGQTQRARRVGPVGGFYDARELQQIDAANGVERRRARRAGRDQDGRLLVASGEALRDHEASAQMTEPVGVVAIEEDAARARIGVAGHGASLVDREFDFVGVEFDPRRGVFDRETEARREAVVGGRNRRRRPREA
jgi:hypothetical protein